MSRGSVFSWAMYDWANSAYVLTVATAVLPAYFAAAVAPNGLTIGNTLLAPTTLWGLAVGLSALLVFLVAPILGAAADISGHKRSWLAAFLCAGALAALGLSFSTQGDILSCLGLFVLAQVGFAGANVFYDAFLPEISNQDDMDRVSGYGFALGYIGGGLQFLLSLGLITLHDTFGLTVGQASRFSMAMAAIWWAGFGAYAVSGLPENGQKEISLGKSIREGVKVAKQTGLSLFSPGPRSAFLIAFLFYNDGIQTVITMATIYGKEELGLPMSALMLTLLVIQAVAFVGALIFSRLAGYMGTRNALLLSLAIWVAVTFWGRFIDSQNEFFILGALVGLVLGGSQSLGRSLFARFIPKDESARYFGYYSVVAKFSAITGPLAFALVHHMTGSARPAVWVVCALLGIGMLLLTRVGEE